MKAPVRKPTLSAEEARRLHDEALVIDSQQPSATTGFLFTETMREAVGEYAKQGMPRARAMSLLQAMAAREIRTSAEARQAYVDLWDRSGVDVASATYAGPGPFDGAFERSVKSMAEARGIIDALEDRFLLVRSSADIETAHRQRRHGIIFDFQETAPFGSDLGRIELFYNLGLRVVQLTYNLRNPRRRRMHRDPQERLDLLWSGDRESAQRAADGRRRQPLQRAGGMGRP